MFKAKDTNFRQQQDNMVRIKTHKSKNKIRREEVLAVDEKGQRSLDTEENMYNNHSHNSPIISIDNNDNKGNIC